MTPPSTLFTANPCLFVSIASASTANPGDHHPSSDDCEASQVTYHVHSGSLCHAFSKVQPEWSYNGEIPFPHLKLFNGFSAALRVTKKALNSSCKNLHALTSVHTFHSHFLLSQQTGLLNSSCLPEHLCMLLPMARRLFQYRYSHNLSLT